MSALSVPAYAEDTERRPSTKGGGRDDNPASREGGRTENKGYESDSGYLKLDPVFYQPHYRRVDAFDFGVTAAFGITTIASRIVGPRSGGPQGGVWFDESLRRRMRARSVEGRITSADVSDVLLGLTVSYALMGDALVNASWLRRSPDVGREVFWMSSEVLAVTLGVQQLTASLVGRERPYGRTCGTSDLPEDTHRCRSRDRYRSFFSGHTSVPFSMAAASCTHHLYLKLSGDSAWIQCGAGFLAAAASGTMRVVADYHYPTDVITGALVGTTIGFGIPLLHYATGTKATSDHVGAVRMQILPTWGGLTLYGVMP